MADASDSKVLEAIGRFVFQFSQLEYTIRVALRINSQSAEWANLPRCHCFL